MADLVQELEAHIATLTNNAVSSLDAAPITDTAKTELIALADYVSWRNI